MSLAERLLAGIIRIALIGPWQPAQLSAYSAAPSGPAGGVLAVTVTDAGALCSSPSLTTNRAV